MIAYNAFNAVPVQKEDHFPHSTVELESKAKS